MASIVAFFELTHFSDALVKNDSAGTSRRPAFASATHRKLAARVLYNESQVRDMCHPYARLTGIRVAGTGTFCFRTAHARATPQPHEGSNGL
ncbi:hypothetical protein [Acidiferrobacter sp.]|uniref:hypothetical protein n=1 Tax=Acidiferrobacter sp. TaxID=1872107 RepID=UPI0026201F44|nr:hypothetical protein [Acidiferrobacter sp.]